MQYRDLSAFYDALTEDIPYDRWAAFVREHAPFAPGDPGADCACGTGSLTVRLAASGLRMIGVDLSEEMLQQAAQKARHAAQPIQFVCQDIARLQLPKPVALLTCACDGVNYLPDAEAVRAFFAASFRALRAGGTFIFDVSTEYKFTHILDHQLYFEDREDVSYFWRSTFSQKERRLKMELTFFVHQRGDQYLRFDEVHVQRCYSCRELCDWLAAAGFEKVQAFEDYSDAPPTETSRRITFCARKPA